MKVSLEGAPEDSVSQRVLIEQLLSLVESKEREIQRLQQQVEALKKLHFGKKSEQLDPLQQLLDFGTKPLAGPEDPANLSSSPDAPPEESSEKPAPPRRIRGGLPDRLQRLTVEYTLPPEKRTCSCGEICERIGEETSEQIEYVPSALVVIRHERVKYACKACEGHIATAPVPDKVIEKGRPGSGLLASIIVSKYCDHLPLHRQEQVFERLGHRIARSTMCDWVDLCADLLSPIVQRMWSLIAESFALHTDDTIVPIQDRTRDSLRRAHLWVYCGDRDHPYIFYEYSPRHQECYPLERLKDYRGYIQADGYSAYPKLANGTDRWLVACWAHARRYFFDAQKNDKLRATTALAYIQQLYAVEKEAKEQKLNLLERYALREARSVPVLREFKEWIDKQRVRVLPNEAIGKAISYALTRWSDLTRYTTDGRLKIDNNVAEQAIRSIAVGRKNWLFAANDDGGHRAAILYSVVQSCRRNGIEPFEYIRDVLERVSTHPASAIDELLPGRWTARKPILPILLKPTLQQA